MHEPAKEPLAYEQRTTFVGRRQFRWLMALTLLNTVLLAGFVVGPMVGPMTRTWWKQFQDARVKRATEKERASAIAAAKLYAPPGDLIVYEENPDEAAKLLRSDPTRYSVIGRASVPYFAPRPWQSPVQLNAPTELKPTVLRVGDAVVFAHARTSPAGQERLVCVNVEANQEAMAPGSDQGKRYYTIKTHRVLTARVFTETGVKTAVQLSIDRRGNGRSSVVWSLGKAQHWEHGEVEFNLDGLFRIYAGQADAKDPSHFTIDYELEGKRGTIDGWLRDGDKVDLTPRSGSIVNVESRGRLLTWDPTVPPAGTQTAK